MRLIGKRLDGEGEDENGGDGGDDGDGSDY